MSPSEGHTSADDVDTVGWGSTKVGTLLKAKVRGFRSFAIWTRVREFDCGYIRSDVWYDGMTWTECFVGCLGPPLASYLLIIVYDL